MPDPTPHRLSDAEMKQVLRRAQEIEGGGSDIEVEGFIAAAEEAGVSRAATMQALQERLQQAQAVVNPGTMVFAKSADGHFYAATTLGTDATGTRVRFLNGGEHLAALDELRPLSLMPGLKLNYQSPTMGNIWVDGELQSVNLEAKSVTINNWGTQEEVPLARVRLTTPKLGAASTGSLWALAGWITGATTFGLWLSQYWSPFK